MESQMEEAASGKELETEGMAAVIGGTGGEDMEEKSEKAAAEMLNWEKVVDLVPADFGKGLLVEEATRQVAVLIFKGEREYREIGLVEVIWKEVAAILNCQIVASITYNDFLHGFRAGRGTGTAAIEEKLRQK